MLSEPDAAKVKWKLGLLSVIVATSGALLYQVLSHDSVEEQLHTELESIPVSKEWQVFETRMDAEDCTYPESALPATITRTYLAEGGLDESVQLGADSLIAAGWRSPSSGPTRKSDVTEPSTFLYKVNADGGQKDAAVWAVGEINDQVKLFLRLEGSHIDAC